LSFSIYHSQAGQPRFHQLAKTVRVLAAIVRDPVTLVRAWQVNQKHDLPRRFGLHGAAMALKPYRPFGCAHWSPATKLERIAAHFAILDALGGMIAPERGAPRRLMSLPSINPDLWLAIDEPAVMMQDGLAVLSLMHGESRIFQITFTLAEAGNGMEAYVGGIQGRAGELDLYRDLTKACHGLRPRDLMIDLFRFFCAELGVRRVHAIAESATYHSDPYFGAHPYQTARMNYDEIWVDRNATKIDGAWFQLPMQSQHRDPEDIPARKRSLYRRRYAMLDGLRLAMGEAVAMNIPGAVELRAATLRREATPPHLVHQRLRAPSPAHLRENAPALSSPKPSRVAAR